jgi:hypothetical protein
MIQFSYEQLLEPYLKQAGSWQLKFAVVPHRCAVSGQRIWLEHAYRGTRTIRSGDQFMTEHFWINRSEFVIWRLKNV